MHEPDADAERFELGVRMLRTSEPMWAMQMELAGGGDIELLILEESLGGEHDLIAGIVHLAVVPLVEAFARIGLHEGHHAALGKAVSGVRIAHAPVGESGTTLSIDWGTLHLTVDARGRTDEPPPIEHIAALLRTALGLPAIA